MDTAGYTALNRQAGLMREMQGVANNIANLSTTGFRKEGVIFAEHVHALGLDAGSVSMSHASVRNTDLTQGTLTQTGATYDFAIQGDGFFSVETPQGQRLTRAGAFTPNEVGELVTPDGHRVLDIGGAPIFIPPDIENVAVASDGTLSAGQRVLGQLGVFQPEDVSSLSRQSGALLQTDSALLPVENATVVQGFLENSNVNPIHEIARMIEVQHAYQLGQSFLEREDSRIRDAIRALGE